LEFLLRAHLRRQAMAVPAEAAFDTISSHRLVPRNDVFYVPGQKVPIVGQSVGKRGSVIEDKLVVNGASFNRRFERIFDVPPLKNASF